MSGTNTTIQDDDPTFITYSAGWIYNNSDPHYDASNYHATTQLGATLTLKFTGSRIDVTGAKKPEYGSYAVEVDGRTVTTNHSSFSPAQLFRQPIISVQGLPDGLHSIRIINRGPGFDVDTFTFISTPKPASNDTKPSTMIIAAVLAAIGVFALVVVILLLRQLPRFKREKRRPYGGGISTETLVQAHPYDYVPPEDLVNRRSKYSDQDLPNIPAAAFMGSPVSVHPASTHRMSLAMGGSDHPDTSLPYLAKDTDWSTTATSQSSISSTNSVNFAQRPPVTNFTPPFSVPRALARPASIRPVSVGSASTRPSVRPLSIAGQPGSIRPSVSRESPFDSRRICSFYRTQPTIREYSKRDTIFGKRSMDERGRVDLLADDVPGSAPPHETEFFSPRTAPHPPMDRSIAPASPSYPSPLPPDPDHDGPPHVTLNTTILSPITEPALSTGSSPSVSTMHFASRPHSGATQPPSTSPSRSNSKGESLFSTSEKRSSTGSKSQREWRRSSLLPSVPPLPSLPEPESDPVSLVPLAPPPPVTTRHQRAAGSLGSVGSMAGVMIRTPNTAMFNSPVMKNHAFVGAGVGLPSSPRPVWAPSPPQTSSQSPPSPFPPFARGVNANTGASSPRSSSAGMRTSGMRMVDLEAGVVGIIEEKRPWTRVRSMMGVVGDTNKDEALFELVAGTPPPLPSPAPAAPGWQGAGWPGQWQWPRQGGGGQKQRQGWMQGMQGPREAPPAGKVGGPRVLRKPAPLALGGLSNFEPPVYDGSASPNANGIHTHTRFVRDDVVFTSTKTKTTSPPPAGDLNSRTKKMSILQSAVIHGRANKEEVEFVTGMKMDSF